VTEITVARGGQFKEECFAHQGGALFTTTKSNLNGARRPSDLLPLFPPGPRKRAKNTNDESPSERSESPVFEYPLGIVSENGS